MIDNDQKIAYPPALPPPAGFTLLASYLVPEEVQVTIDPRFEMIWDYEGHRFGTCIFIDEKLLSVPQTWNDMYTMLRRYVRQRGFSPRDAGAESVSAA